MVYSRRQISTITYLRRCAPWGPSHLVQFKLIHVYNCLVIHRRQYSMVETVARLLLHPSRRQMMLCVTLARLSAQSNVQTVQCKHGPQLDITGNTLPHSCHPPAASRYTYRVFAISTGSNSQLIRWPTGFWSDSQVIALYFFVVRASSFREFSLQAAKSTNKV